MRLAKLRHKFLARESLQPLLLLASLQHDRLRPFLCRWLQVRVSLEKARAGVPAQDGIVVRWRADCFRLLVPIHRLAERLVYDVRRALAALLQNRLGPPLTDDS